METRFPIPLQLPLFSLLLFIARAMLPVRFPTDALGYIRLIVLLAVIIVAAFLIATLLGYYPYCPAGQTCF